MIRAAIEEILRRLTLMRPGPADPEDNHGYPPSAINLIDDEMAYRQGTIPAIRAFKRNYGGTDMVSDVRLSGIRILVYRLCQVYEVEPITVTTSFLHGGPGNGSYCPATREINLVGRLSIITTLHEFAHAIYGPSEVQAVRWSINLFKRVWPRQFAEMSEEGHMLRRREVTADGRP